VSNEVGYPGVGRVLVIIPTYNEAENVPLIVERVRRAVPQVDILIADDNSPDGTGEIADRIAGSDKHVHVLHRPGKQGLGAAYVAGFGWARDHSYDAVVEMDADGSHAPEELSKLLDALQSADGVIGSRWVRGGSVVNWPMRREALSRTANLYTRLAIGLPVHDATGGYRAYRMPLIDKIEVDSVDSQGYCFQVDITRRAHRAGFKLVEVPIRFTDRQHGVSKMGSGIIGEALWRVAVWGTQDRLNGLKRAVSGKRGGARQWP
jgi:dolichol-phosphate mannosyltransferase